MTGRTGSDNLTSVLLGALRSLEGLIDEQIRTKLLCFGANGVAMLQDVKGGVASEGVCSFPCGGTLHQSQDKLSSL